MEWIVSRSRAKFGGWHIQARTKDQLCSMAVVVTDEEAATVRRGGGVGGQFFTMVIVGGNVTMNLFGKIKYQGEWKEAIHAPSKLP